MKSTDNQPRDRDCVLAAAPRDKGDKELIIIRRTRDSSNERCLRIRKGLICPLVDHVGTEPDGEDLPA